MFAVATRNFVEEVDPCGGLLIPVSSPNDGITVLSLVVRRKRFWLWQKPKYQPTDFQLNDILTGDTPIQPVLVETDFVKYSGSFDKHVQGNFDASFIELGGKDSSKLQSSFGSLKKVEVDVQKLLRDCKHKVLDMSHGLIQQAKDKHRRALCFVKEQIITTQPCSVIEEVQLDGKCGGSFTTCGPKIPKVTLKENGSLSKDSNITMEIPPRTTIAYGLIELEIKHDGQFELCLMSDITGGFEVDGPLRTVSASVVHSTQNSRLQQEMQQLSDQFQLLSALSPTTRSSVLQQITKVMQDRATVNALQRVVSEMYLDHRPDLSDLALTELQQQNIKAILDILEQSSQERVAAGEQSTPLYSAFHMMTSALEELTNDSLAILGTCCSPNVLQTLEQIVQCVAGSGEMTLSSGVLAQDIFEKVQHLFASSNVSLKKDGNMLKTEISLQQGHLPLVLCIAITCLASLACSV